VSDLPSGWKHAPLRELGTWMGGGTPSKARADYWADGTIPWISPKDMKSDILSTAADFITEEAVVASATRIIRCPAVLVVTRSGILSHTLPVGVTTTDAAINQDIKALVPHAGVDPYYVAYALRSFAQPLLTACSKHGTTVASMESKRLLDFEIPLAPPAQQRRIVELLDSQLSRLDATRATLERAAYNLRRYRASIHLAAFEGRLVPTEADVARREQRAYEPASELLKRVLAARRAKATAKYAEPAAPESNDLPELPEGWCWASLDALTEIVGGITKNQKRIARQPSREVPYLRVANVQRGYLDLSSVTKISATESEIDELRLLPNDILFNEGGDRDKLGRGWIWSGEIRDCIHQNHVFRARPILPDLSARYISWYGNTGAQAFFIRRGTQTTNLASLSKTQLRTLPVPLPPAAEQDRIAAEVSRQLTIVDAIETTVRNDLARMKRVRSGMMRAAFRGELA